MADKPETAFVDYTPKGLFTKGTLLRHATFGKGLVLSAEGQRMEVLFAESKKTLVMGTTLVPRANKES